MTLSDEQRYEVNRKNSQQSTGPRTAAGKSRSKLNGLKHGLRAATLVLPGEDPEALEHRFDAWTEELDPRTDLERYFVRSAVEAAWRLDRVRRAEAAAVARRVTRAGARADRKDALEVEHSLKYLGLWPEKNLRTLRGSARGCRALLERWRELVAGLEHAGSWLDSERRWAFALAGLKPHRWHEDAAVLRLVTLDLATQVDGCSPDETRLFVVAHLKHDEADMNITPYRVRGPGRGDPRRPARPRRGAGGAAGVGAGVDRRARGAPGRGRGVRASGSGSGGRRGDVR